MVFLVAFRLLLRQNVFVAEHLDLKFVHLGNLLEVVQHKMPKIIFLTHNPDTNKSEEIIQQPKDLKNCLKSLIPI